MNSMGCGGVEIRMARQGDKHGIVTLVRTCQPYLTAHMSYIYWIDIRYWWETCLVAELGGEVVGWCSIIPVPNGKYLIHQLAVAPGVRRKGLAESLVGYMLDKLKGGQQAAAFEVELTIDRKNGAALGLFKTIAEHAGMRLVKRPEVVVSLLEEECDEELYVMTAA